MKDITKINRHGDSCSKVVYYACHAPIKAESERMRLKKARAKIREKRKK